MLERDGSMCESALGFRVDEQKMSATVSSINITYKMTKGSVDNKSSVSFISDYFK